MIRKRLTISLGKVFFTLMLVLFFAISTSASAVTGVFVGSDSKTDPTRWYILKSKPGLMICLVDGMFIDIRILLMQISIIDN